MESVTNATFDADKFPKKCRSCLKLLGKEQMRKKKYDYPKRALIHSVSIHLTRHISVNGEGNGFRDSVLQETRVLCEGKGVVRGVRDLRSARGWSS